jgi:hypothetical protein
MHRNAGGVIHKVTMGDLELHNVVAVKLEESVNEPSRVTVTFFGHAKFVEYREEQDERN